MAVPTSGTLTGAGYALVAGTAATYNKTFGTIVVSFNIAQPVSGSSVTVTPTGDNTAADWASVIASIQALTGQPVNAASYSGLASPVGVQFNPVNYMAVNGLQSWGMVLS